MAASVAKSMTAVSGMKATLSSVLKNTIYNHDLTKLLSAKFSALDQVRHLNNKQRVRQPRIEVEKSKKFIPKIKKKALIEDVEDTSTIIAQKPVDNIWIRKFYPRQHYSIEEAIEKHKMFAHPSMLNNMSGVIYLDLKLDCTTNKQTKFISPIRSTVRLPHEFVFGKPPNILIFCKSEENLKLAETLGSKYYGTPEDVMKMINNGVISPSDFEHVLATQECALELLPVRSHFKDRFPQKAKGTLGTELQEMWDLYYNGYTYESQKVTDALGRLQVPFGRLQQPTKELVDNFKTYIDHICKHKSLSFGPFITSIVAVAPPSVEEFHVRVADYVPGYKNEVVDSDDEEEEVAQA